MPTIKRYDSLVSDLIHEPDVALKEEKKDEDTEPKSNMKPVADSEAFQYSDLLFILDY